MNWRERYGLPERPPSDLVPSKGMTVETLRTLDQAVGQPVRVTEPGELVEDVDGMPLVVGPSDTTTETMASPLIHIDAFRRLGADPADFPNLTVYDPDNREDDHA